MKTLSVFFLFLAFSFEMNAQSSSGYQPRIATGAPLVGGRTMDMNITSRAIDVSGFDKIDGTPFLTSNYVNSYIRLKSGHQFNNVWTRFNTYNNEVILQRTDNDELLALQSIDSMAFTKPGENSELVILKTGYPSIGKNNKETFYEMVAATDRVVLLKYYKTTLEKVKKMGMPDKDAFVQKNTYYIFDKSTNELAEVKLSAKSILPRLTMYPRVKDTAGKLSVNFKNEQDLKRLFRELN